MVWILDSEGVRVIQCRSDSEAVRWWRANGEDLDTLEDTGELMTVLDSLLED